MPRLEKIKVMYEIEIQTDANLEQVMERVADYKKHGCMQADIRDYLDGAIDPTNAEKVINVFVKLVEPVAEGNARCPDCGRPYAPPETGCRCALTTVVLDQTEVYTLCVDLHDAGGMIFRRTREPGGEEGQWSLTGNAGAYLRKVLGKDTPTFAYPIGAQVSYHARSWYVVLRRSYDPPLPPAFNEYGLAWHPKTDTPQHGLTWVYEADIALKEEAPHAVE